MDKPERMETLRAALAEADALRPALDPAAPPRAADPVAFDRSRIAAIDTRWLPALVAHIGRTVAGLSTVGEPDAVRTAQAVVTLVRTAGPAGAGREATQQALRNARRHVRVAAQQVHEVLADELTGADAPDIAALSREMLRLEALRFLADTLEDVRADSDFAGVARRVARVALNRAAATIDAFVAERDLMRLFDNAVVVGRVDDMLTLALRVLDGKAAREEEATAFVEPADQAALRVFVESLDRLAEALLSLAARAAAGKGGDGFFPGLLAQIGCVLAFCRRLTHGERPALLDAIAARLVDGLGRMADHLARESRDDPAARRRGEQLVVALDAMDLPKTAAALARLRPAAMRPLP